MRQPTTAQDAASDLHALLSAAKEPTPYVMVGHSYGGMVARLYASTYPDDVSGLVLVDALTEGLQETETPEQWAVQRLGAFFALLAHPYQPSPNPLSGRPAHRPFRGLFGGPSWRLV